MQSDTGTPVIAYAIIEIVRFNHMLIKFDRVSGSYLVTDLNVTENFTGTGSQIEFNVKWPISVKPADTKVVVDTVEQLLVITLLKTF